MAPANLKTGTRAAQNGVQGNPQDRQNVDFDEVQLEARVGIEFA